MTVGTELPQGIRCFILGTSPLLILSEQEQIGVKCHLVVIPMLYVDSTHHTNQIMLSSDGGYPENIACKYFETQIIQFFTLRIQLD